MERNGIEMEGKEWNRSKLLKETKQIKRKKKAVN